VVARSDFNVLNSHCYSMYLSRCKFEFSNDPKQFYNFVNAISSALPSSVRLNSMEASTDSEVADSAAWSNSNYPNPLNRANCILTPLISESFLLTITSTYSPGPDGCVLKFCASTIYKPILKLFNLSIS